MNTPIFRGVRSGMLSMGTPSRIDDKIDDRVRGFPKAGTIGRAGYSAGSFATC